AVSIGQLIRTTRESKKISQENLALQCGIDRSYLGRIERGEVNITINKLYIIANILHVEAKTLLP
ncbi:helix-turn-helix domain-containing protein, partial [Acinetobacter junii]